VRGARRVCPLGKPVSSTRSLVPTPHTLFTLPHTNGSHTGFPLHDDGKLTGSGAERATATGTLGEVLTWMRHKVTLTVGFCLSRQEFEQKVVWLLSSVFPGWPCLHVCPPACVDRMRSVNFVQGYTSLHHTRKHCVDGTQYYSNHCDVAV
jgi:hypothetical protein